MATQQIHAGTKFQIFNRISTGPSVYEFLCMASTKAANFASEMEDATVYDCADPTKVPVRKSIVRKRMLDVPISGKVDALKFKALRDAEEDSTTLNLKIVIDVPLAQGGGYWSGDFRIESLEVASSDNGIVTFSAQLKSDGEYPWTDAAA